MGDLLTGDYTSYSEYGGRERVTTSSREIRTGTYKIPKEKKLEVEKEPIETETKPVVNIVATRVETPTTYIPVPKPTPPPVVQPKPPQPIQQPPTQFGFGLTQQVQQKAPLIPDAALRTPEGRFASIGRTAIVAGASTLDILGEFGKRTVKGDIGGVAGLGGAVAYGATVGSALEVKSAGESLLSGDVGGASQKLSMFGASLAVGQAAFSFGKGFGKQGLAVAESGFRPTGLAKKYGALEVAGFAKQPLAKARAQSQLESFRSSPPFSALSEAAASKQGYPLSIKYSKPIGKVTAEATFIPEKPGLVYYVKREQFTEMYQKSKFPVTTEPMLTEKGVVASVGAKQFEDKFAKSEFHEELQYTPKGVELVVIKRLDLSKPPQPPARTLQPPSDTDPFNPSAVSRGNLVSVQKEGMFERQQRRFNEPLFIEKPSEVKLVRPEPINIPIIRTETGTSFKTISIPRTESITRLIIKPLPKIPQDELSRIIEKTREENINKVIIKPFSISKTKTSTILINPTPTLEKMREKTLTETVPLERLRFREYQDTFKSTKYGLSAGKSKLGLFSQKFTGFLVIGRKAGKEIVLNSRPLVKEEALSFGQRFLGLGSQRTIRLRPFGTAERGRFSVRQLREQLYTPKTIKPMQAGEEVFTQKPKFSIFTAAEKMALKTARALKGGK